jgi:hypothetical protein
VGGYNRDNIIPYGSLNKKTYFKTIEHIIQNTNNKTYQHFDSTHHQASKKPLESKASSVEMEKEALDIDRQGAIKVMSSTRNTPENQSPVNKNQDDKK